MLRDTRMQGFMYKANGQWGNLKLMDEIAWNRNYIFVIFRSTIRLHCIWNISWRVSSIHHGHNFGFNQRWTGCGLCNLQMESEEIWVRNNGLKSEIFIFRMWPRWVKLYLVKLTKTASYYLTWILLICQVD